MISSKELKLMITSSQSKMNYHRLVQSYNLRLVVVRNLDPDVNDKLSTPLSSGKINLLKVFNFMLSSCLTLQRFMAGHQTKLMSSYLRKLLQFYVNIQIQISLGKWSYYFKLFIVALQL